ncbi:SMP-30/gluconolactonase/LRE family protein [Actinoplanes sp. M2I2]|uniref:SMP-30/gluconolactonase/LRE family protein n=1 Tax=Actinoplanes sp. M2I2 TaxID=1734444 RepID=UPI0020222B15|nr:SMP-30/gluconolactonase/LRE family protein [Actinoplanes sp. M2I2]
MTVTYTARAVTEVRAEHAEGPAWDGRREELLWVDQFAGLVHRARYTGGELRPVRTYQVGRPVGAVVPISGADGWMLAAGAGFLRLSADGRTEVVAEPEAAVRDTNRMNDGKCDPRGRFYAGSMAWSKRAGAGSLYRYDGQVHAILRDVTISNGLAWSAAGDLMYYIDTPTGRVDVFTVGRDGEPVDRRPAFAIDPADGAPDGMCADDEDCLWVALWGGHQVCRYAPTGEKLATVEVPAPQVSSCAFGGRTLFITTSQEGYTPADSARHPDAGRLFAVDLPVGGPAATPFTSRS